MTDVNSESFWAEKYRGGIPGWDLGTPTPVFESLLDEGAFSAPAEVFVPCSGNGYDAILFAERGFQVTAVDIAPSPLRTLDSEAQARGLDIEIIHGDMFTLGARYEERFDYIIEYTCLCAIDTARRDEYLALLKRLLKPGGRLVALVFPIDGRPGGPPYHIDPKQVEDTASSGFRLIRKEFHPASIKPRAGKEMLYIWERADGNP